MKDILKHVAIALILGIYFIAGTLTIITIIDNI